MYGWTPEIVGRLTAAQQAMYLNSDDGTETFATVQEARAFISAMKNGE